MSLTLSERALEIIEDALFYGTITFGDKTTVLKPETVLNLAKSLSVKQKEVKDESVDMPVDFFPSQDKMTFDSALITSFEKGGVSSQTSQTSQTEDDLNQLSFPFTKHDGK